MGREIQRKATERERAETLEAIEAAAARRRADPAPAFELADLLYGDILAARLAGTP